MSPGHALPHPHPRAVNELASLEGHHPEKEIFETQQEITTFPVIWARLHPVLADTLWLIRNKELTSQTVRV